MNYTQPEASRRATESCALTKTMWRPPWGLLPIAVPAGVHWDAVRVPERVGWEVVRWLGDACGAVIGDSRGGVLYWLVGTDGAADWDAFPAAAGVHHLGDACWVTVPGAGRTAPPGPYWAVPYGPQGALTRGTLLHTALARVLGTGAPDGGPS